LVQDVATLLRSKGGAVEEVFVRTEDIHFSLPKELTDSLSVV
jgi:hypothetical protein